jgi:hypothetical protein
MLTQTRTRISSSVDEDGGRIRSHQQQQQPYCPPFRIIVLALLTGLGGILFGYDLVRVSMGGRPHLVWSTNE